MAKPTASGATPARPRSRIAAWAEHHRDSLIASLGRMFGKPWSTLLTVGVMAVALALPLGLALVLDNAARLGGTIERAREVTVFLKQDIAVERARALAQTLRARGDIAAVALRTPDEGLASLRDDGGTDVYADALAAVGENPLPSVLIVRPRGDERALVAALTALPEADLVQHDAVWRERLDRWLGFGERVVWVLAALLGLGALLVVGNTVRLDIQSRREEIAVLQSLGATDGFIRRPFLYLGACYGLAAGALALGLLTAAEFALRLPLRALADSYGSRFAFSGMEPLHALLVLAVAGALGWLGAGVVTGHFLRQTKV
ncbi:MAG: ABC transporter permease [Xanthomonadales bacterium]|nr:ABC transporter permease [Xanthomonadales bacterium]